jgi:hypothetical protein
MASKSGVDNYSIPTRRNQRLLNNLVASVQQCSIFAPAMLCVVADTERYPVIQL